MSDSATLEWLLRPAASDTGIDRKALAGLLAELARNLDARVGPQLSGIEPVDPRLEELRTVLVGHEIEVLKRLSRIIEDPEELAAAVSRVLPNAIAQASTRDSRMGQALAPAVEKATQSSIRSDPRTLVNILYPLIVPAMRKSIGEIIESSFQSFNESLKYSLSWRGLAWRWEAWRTGTTFSQVVLQHTLVYQIEHVFLIHRHTGLLIAHVAGADAESQDPQLVSSMLMAIQDFVRDSFSGADQQGLDTLRLGELTLWSEPGPYATLVAVIRGKPPEALHDTMRDVLSRIHAERPKALETFDGDGETLAGVEVPLGEIVGLRQQAPRSSWASFPWLMVLGTILVIALFGWWGYRSWHDHKLWQNYLATLRAQPGLVITEAGTRDGKWLVSGLRDPLAADPAALLRATEIDPTRVIEHWAPYQGLDPLFVLERLKGSLDPPPSVTLGVEDDRIVAHGAASYPWLQRARAAARMLPSGAPTLDLSQVQDLDVGAIGALREAIQSNAIKFDNNDPLPSRGQDELLDQVAKQLNDLVAMSGSLRVSTRVTLTGHSDAIGQGMFNLSLSLARAEAVRALLKKRGVNPDLLAVRGAGPLEPLEPGATEAARSANRRVSFTVEIDQ